MVVCTARPGTGGSREAAPPSRTTCPSALTSTKRTPSAPRSESSYWRSSPPFPRSPPSRTDAKRRSPRAVSVGDDAAGRGQRDGSQAVRFRLQLVFRMVQDLGAEKHQHQGGPRAQHHGPREAEAPLEQVRVERAHASLSRIARCRPNNHSTRTPATAVVRL